MYGNPEYPLQKLPEGFIPHNSIGRPQKPERVRLILRHNPDDMQRRKELWSIRSVRLSGMTALTTSYAEERKW